MTLVSIVTPTFPGREEELVTRCIPSVLNLDWPDIEHIIVSDRNPDLREEFRDFKDLPGRRVRFTEINESWRNPLSESCIGSVPWGTGCLLALGEYVGFLGDDDEYFPDHVSRHVTAMQSSGALWSVSQIEFRAGGVPQFLVGNDSFAHGHLDSDGIMCHVSALATANWPLSTEHSAAGDYRLVRDWRAAGLPGLYIGDGPTGIHHDGWVVGKTGRPDRPQ